MFFSFFQKLKGASPLEVDPCRNLRPDQWARFVGRHTTAEVIEECARSKLLGQNTYNLAENHSSFVQRKTNETGKGKYSIGS